MPIPKLMNLGDERLKSEADLKKDSSFESVLNGKVLQAGQVLEGGLKILFYFIRKSSKINFRYL